MTFFGYEFLVMSFEFLVMSYELSNSTLNTKH